jgi:hypothetical protein
MDGAVRRGLHLRSEFGITGISSEDEVDAVLGAHGIEVGPPMPFRGRIRGVLLGDMIYLRGSLERGERTVVKAHELGHHLLHETSAFYMNTPLHVGLGSRQEREAHLFAGALVLGRPPASTEGVADLMQDGWHAGVPASFLFEWVNTLVTVFPVVDGVPGWVLV